MFWGLIMEPHRRYTQVVKKPFHISMASLDLSTSSEEPAQIMCGFQGRNYLLCTLRKPDMLQCSLDLNFEAGDELSLATNGKCHIHLTGYLIETGLEDLEEEEDEEEVEEEEEVVDEKPTKKKNKRNKVELENGPPTKKAKADKQKAESDEEDDSDMDVNALLNNTFDSDDDDDTFNTSDQEEEEDEAVEEEEGGENEWEDAEDSSLSESEDETPQPQQSKINNKGKVNGTPQKQEEQKDKKNKKKKQQQQDKAEKTISPKKESPKKVLQNGLIIEDLKEGQGAPAKSGKFVTVYYEGRLKSNNKVFDSSNKGQGFSFRLGGGEVIKGWDQGLLGMKIGGKRRITCPPNMAYGAKGSPPAIPGNSTLVFEVELKKVR